MQRLATLALLGLSLFICAGPAAAKTWTSGQTASYTVHVHGPGHYLSDAPGDASLDGDTFQQALREHLGGRLSATGRGTGGVRWVEFETDASRAVARSSRAPSKSRRSPDLPQVSSRASPACREW